METKKLSGKKIIMVIAPDQFRDEELLVPRKIWEEAGATVKVASRSKMECVGMLGAKVKPDLLVSEVRMKDYDAIAVVGGMGSPEFLWNDDQLHSLLAEANTARKPTAAICLSGAVLAKAGVLRGHRATVYKTPESVRELELGGATYTGEPVTVDGNLITGQDPDAAQAFADAVMERLAGKAAAA